MSFQDFEHPWTTYRSKLSRKIYRKRKREDEPDEDPMSDGSEDDPRPKSSQSTWAELLPDEAQRRKAAGIAADEEIPGNGFPHRPADYKPQRRTGVAPSQIQEELSKLKPPLHGVLQIGKENSSTKSGLKQQHISVLYTLLHKLLMEKDYTRASRAFGLLLRTSSLGQLPDLRDKNLWGIGAEILLKRKGQTQRPDVDNRETAFDKQGVEEAKQYFEKLIVQFPYRVQNPKILSALHFYPVYFNLWIASADDKHKAALHSIRGNSVRSDTSYTIEQLDEIKSIRISILQQAKEIFERLEEVMRTIPYSDDPNLWNLKGNMYLWIGDLSEPQDQDEIERRSTSNSISEQSPDMNYRDIAKRNAEVAFSKAKSHEVVKQDQKDFQDSDTENV